MGPKRYAEGALVLFLYVAGAVLLTWPLCLNMGTTLFGDFGDPRGEAWRLWAVLNGHHGGALCRLVAAPFGIPTDPGFSQPVTEGLHLLLGRLSNEIVAHNAYVLLSFPLTAFSAYLLFRSLLRDGWAAGLGGAAFGFAPAAVMQSAGGHPSLAFNVFFPLLVWALFHNRERRTLWSAFLVSGFFALVTATAMYMGYFSIYVVVFFALADLLLSKDKGAVVMNYAVVALFAGLFGLAMVYERVLGQISSPEVAGASVKAWRSFGELKVYSARPLEYLLPSIDHPVLGGLFSGYVRNHLHGSNVAEQSLYLGVVPLGLFAAGFFAFRRGADRGGLRVPHAFFTAGALLMFILSLPPKLDLGRLELPTISYFAYKIVPMFRVYARAGILTAFFTAGAAAAVLALLRRRMPPARFGALWMFLAALLAFEYWSVPPGYALPVDRPPEVYRWLASEPGDELVAEYPMMRWEEAAYYNYLFWQRVHGKRIVNGASPDNAKAWALFEEARDLSDPGAVPALKAAGVRYVIVHGRGYWEGEIPFALKRYYPPDIAARRYNGGRAPENTGLGAPTHVFGDDAVYDLNSVGQ